MISSFREIFARHRGPFWLQITREVVKKGVTEHRSDRLGLEEYGPVDDPRLRATLSADEAHEEGRTIVNDLDNNVVEVFVFSDYEGQFIGAMYKRGETYRPWHEEEEDLGRMELSDQREQATLLQAGTQPVRQMDDSLDPGLPAEAVSRPRSVRNVPAQESTDPGTDKPRQKRPAPSKLPGDRFPVVRGRALELDLGNAERWPASPPTQLVRTWFEAGKRATSAEVVQALGAQLQALGMQHPASLVSRLKQAGFLKEVIE